VIPLASGCIGVGTRVCAMHQAGCDFTDHVLTVSPSGTLCPTWNVQFAQYNPNGQPTDTYAIASGPEQDSIVATLREASDKNLPVHVWYAGEKFVVYLKCHADYPLVIYDARLESVAP
jgi:hypothetical protein